MDAVLSGIQVVEASAFIAAPLAGMTLAQLGADVIRVDMIGGGLDYHRWPLAHTSNTSLYWTGLNKGKRSIAVNLKSPQGRELVQELISRQGERSGILLSNFANTEWLSLETLRRKRDDVIKVLIQGDHDGRSQVDYTVNCAVGYPTATGLGNPVNHVLPAWDVATGLHAVIGLLAALDYRRRSGEGKLVSIALSDVAFATTANLGHVAEAQINDEQRAQIGNDLYGAFGRDFKTADDRRIMVLAITQKQWQLLCKTTGIHEAVENLEAETGLHLNDEGNRFQLRNEIAALIEPWCAARTLKQIESIFNSAGVSWGPYQSFKQAVAEDRRLSEENPMFSTIQQPGVGPILAPGTPLDFEGLVRQATAPAPRLGQHTEEILAENLHLSEHEIGKLFDRGIVAGADEDTH